MSRKAYRCKTALRRRAFVSQRSCSQARAVSRLGCSCSFCSFVVPISFVYRISVSVCTCCLIRRPRGVSLHTFSTSNTEKMSPGVFAPETVTTLHHRIRLIGGMWACRLSYSRVFALHAISFCKPCSHLTNSAIFYLSTNKNSVPVCLVIKLYIIAKLLWSNFSAITVFA